MSRKDGDAFIVEEEEHAKCELCGDLKELRPYGPNNENICFKCGMENKKVTERKFEERLLGTMH